MRPIVPGGQLLQSEEWWQTDAEACALFLDHLERTMAVIALSDPLWLEFYSLGMRLAVLVARIEAEIAEYFLEKFNATEQLLYE